MVRFALVATLLAFLLFIPVAQASVLGVGGTAPPSPLVPGGTLLTSLSGTVTTFTFSTDYTTWVYSDPFNTWCANCLDFVYQFTNHGPDVNQRFTMYNFGNFNIDAGTNPFGTHDPITVSRSIWGTGQVISFNFDQFGDEITLGETTVLLVIETDALAYTTGYLSVQNGTAGSGIAFAPIPEPASLVMMGTGLLAIGGFLRRSLFGNKA
jgi:hypothetical protein